MIKKCATKLVYLACLFIALAAPPNLHAQTYTLSDGQKLVYNSTGPRIGQASADNGSQTMALSPPAEPAGDPTQGQVFSVSETGMSQSAEGEAGGIGGVVNLITSGYNAVQLSGGGGFDDQGWMAVLPLTPGQVSSGSLIFTQNYILNTITSREWAASYSAYGKGTPQYGGLFTEPATWTPSAGIVAPGDSPKKNQDFLVENIITQPAVAAMNIYSNQTTLATWFHGGLGQNAPGSPWSSISALNATLIWSNGQLHLTDNNVDIIIPVPAGWNGDVAVVNVIEQGPNTSDGWNDYAYYLNATVGTPQPPSGTISVSATQVQAKGKINVSWQLQ